MRKFKRRILAAVLAFALITGLMPTGNYQVMAADANAGKLHVSGTNLYDSKGNIVQLRGISTHGLSWFPEYVNDDCFKQIHDEWKGNVIRLAMYTAEYNGYCTGDAENKKKLKKLVKDGVDYAKKNNLYAIVDWHILSDCDPMTNEGEAEKFFNEMSKTFSGYDNVIYEICNEPNGGTSWSRIKEYANKIIPIIRKNHKDAVIIVGTPTWSQEVDKAAADPLKYDNVMYTLHFYADTHQQWLRDTAEKAIKAGLPIMVTEFSICDASGNGNNNKSEGNKWIAFLDKYNVGYVAWNLSNKSESSSIISSSCNKKSGFSKSDLSDSGKWFVDVLKSHGDQDDSDKGDDSNKDDDSNVDNGDQTAKQATTISIKKKTYSCKASNLKNAKYFKLNTKTNSGARLTFKKKSGSKCLAVTPKGRLKIKAKTKKGSYRIRIMIKAAATDEYKAKSRVVTIKVKVK